MIYLSLGIPDVFLIKPKVFDEERDFFMETFLRSEFEQHCGNYQFVEDNLGKSVHGVLRGLHYQLLQPQGKLVRVARGEVFGVAVDLRQSSPTFGRWVGEFLSEENKYQLWVPPGFAHGFLVTSDEAEFSCKCTDYFAPEDEHVLFWNDPAIGIEWPVIAGEPTLSAKDQQAAFLTDCPKFDGAQSMRRSSKSGRSSSFGDEPSTKSSIRLATQLSAVTGDLLNTKEKSPSLFQAANLWQFGDWAGLASLGIGDGSRVNEGGRIALLSASANFQQGAKERAAELLLQAKKSGCSINEIASILVAGAHLNLGRASYLTGRNYDRSSNHFQQAAKAAFGSECSFGSERVIESEQLCQLGIPALWRKPDLSGKIPTNEVDRLLQSLTEALPEEPAFHVVSAERLQRRGENSNAIRAWQKAAELMGPATPQTYYDRLAEAYRSQVSFPAGRPEDEQIKGKIDKYEVLRQLHQILQPKLYLEIGVQSGKSLALAQCEAVGVDPMPMLAVSLPKTTKIAKVTSDEFFEEHADSMLTRAPDLVFIDGMHLFEYVLRDFTNVERYASSNTVVVLDDIFPNSQVQAARDRVTKVWAGDVWKLFDALARYRKDLKMLPVDSFPTGILLVSQLNPSSEKLAKLYDNLTNKFSKNIAVPNEYLKRTIPCAVSVAEIADMFF